MHAQRRTDSHPSLPRPLWRRKGFWASPRPLATFRAGRCLPRRPPRFTWTAVANATYRVYATADARYAPQRVGAPDEATFVLNCRQVPGPEGANTQRQRQGLHTPVFAAFITLKTLRVLDSSHLKILLVKILVVKIMVY